MKVSVVPNGLGDVVDMSVDKELLRKKWHVGPKEKIILFAGRIDEIKGVSSLIKAFHLVLEAYPNSRLLIAGNGDYTRAFQEAKNIYTKITFTGLLKRRSCLRSINWPMPVLYLLYSNHLVMSLSR